MSSDINLLIKTDAKLLKQKKRLNIFRIIAVGFLVAVLLISTSIYLLNQRLSNSSIKKDQDSLLNQMLAVRKRQAKLTTINNRINNVSDLLKKRVDTHKIVNTLLGKVPDGISVEALEFAEKTISIKISSESLRPVDELINNLIGMGRKKEIINALTLDSLDVTEATGKYIVSIKASLI